MSSFAAEGRSAYDASGAAWADGPQRLYADIRAALAGIDQPAEPAILVLSARVRA